MGVFKFRRRFSRDEIKTFFAVNKVVMKAIAIKFIDRFSDYFKASWFRFS